VHCIYDIFDAYLGLYEIALGPQCFAALSLIVARKRRHHDYFNILRFRL
jgi:hypothetical protein